MKSLMDHVCAGDFDTIQSLTRTQFVEAALLDFTHEDEDVMLRLRLYFVACVKHGEHIARSEIESAIKQELIARFTKKGEPLPPELLS